MAKFQRYHSYKDSGVEWLGEIPRHWEIVRHKYCFVLNKEIVGKNSSNMQLLSLTKNGIKAIDKFNQSGKVPISFDTYQFISKDDIVMCLFDLDVSAVFAGISPHSGMISSAYKSFKCNSNLLAKYCDYFFRNVFVNRKYKIYSKNVRFTMNIDDFMSLCIPVPPKDEQEKIASYLDEKISKIDTAISGKEKLIELLKEQKQIIINDAVTKGLNKNAKFKNSGVEWIGKIPKHWEIQKLKFLANNKSVKSAENDFKISLENIESQTTKYIKTQETAFTDAGINFKKGDVLFGKLRPYLAKVYLAEKDGLCVSEFLVLEAIKIDNLFLKFVLVSNNYIDYINGSTYGTKMPRANWEFIGNSKIPIPQLCEQEKIAEYIENKISKIDKLLNLEQECIKSLKEYKASLIDSVVTGKVKV